MKRIGALLAALALLLSGLSVLAEDLPDGQLPEAPAEQPAQELILPDHLTVGNPTPMRGDFFTDLWGNATSDADVRDLLHGYNLIMWDMENGMFTTDPSVVSGLVLTQNAEGDHIYTLVLQNDLYYSDGTRITAWDYAFSLLFMMSPEVRKIGGTPLRREHIVGYEQYANGTEPFLAGVRVITDDTLTVTINHEYLPFFYEMGLLLCNPYPISVIAPGVQVKDSGYGVYLANIDPEVREPIFNAELLRKTVLDEETGYLSHPSVVSGPYVLTGWDGVTADFAINPYYKGNTDGYRPLIETLTYTVAHNDTMIQELAEGKFGLLNKVMRADRIAAGIEALNEYRLSMSNYPRVGLSYISFTCEKPTVESLAVRQAIAWCMDRDQITEDYTSVFGQRVDGWYGVGQWMFGIIAGSTPPPVTEPEDPNDREALRVYEETVAAFSQLNLDGLTQYGVDLGRAAQLLDGDGWVLNNDGLREKDGVVLDLKLIYPEGNNVYESLQRNLADNLAQVGIRLTLEEVPMSDLLTQWYKQDGREADMIWLASNFYLVFEPSVHFLTKEDGTHNWSYTNLHDEPLYAAAEAMRRTEPGDVLTYMRHWVAFQERFNEILPMIPVYSNIYFDFYTSDLQDYYIPENITWSQAIVPAYLAGGQGGFLTEGTFAQEEPEETDDGEIEIFE